MKNVLVFPCGSEIGLEINQALGGSKHFRLFGASSVDDHGKYVYKNYIGGLPFADSSNFIEELNKIIELYEIDFIVPAHDSAVLKMAENQGIINAAVITSCAETCRICRSKKRTYELFENRMPTPIVYKISDEMDFPVFLKPDVGQGTKGTYVANSKKDVEFMLHKDPTLIILEYLPGKEYTVDCFTDKNGKVLFVGGRERVRIYSGISVNSKPVDDPRFLELAEIINLALSLQGVWFYQVKERANGEFVLLEIAPRVAGTMALFRSCGVNFIELSLFDRISDEISIIYNKLDIELDRALFSRFSIKNDYDCLYIDFDDTIILDNVVNTNVMKLLYQCKNMAKKTILLSKHRRHIKESLKKYAISDLLFDEIIILEEDEEKAKHITNMNSIFIDDSFAERKKVFDELNIPVFSLDSLGALIHWKV